MNKTEPPIDAITQLLEQIKTCAGVRMGSLSDKLDVIYEKASEALAIAIHASVPVAPSEIRDNKCPDCGATMLEVCSGLEINARGEAAGLCRHSDYCEKPPKPVMIALSDAVDAIENVADLNRHGTGMNYETMAKAVLDAAGVKYVA